MDADGTMRMRGRRGAGRRRHLVPFAAALLLLQALLTPFLHDPSAAAQAESLGAVGHHGATHVGHAHHPGAHDGPAESGDGAASSDHHQPCHFCRLQGAALAPPSTGAIVRAALPTILPWRPTARPDVAAQHFRAVLQARAPPYRSASL